MTRILLIRHATANQMGRVLYGRTPGVHLTAEGRREAETLGHALKARYSVRAVISSPLERATETAQFIANAQALDVSRDEGLNEIDFGHWMGKAFSELDQLRAWHDYNRVRSLAHAPGGESLVEVQTRAWASVAAKVAIFPNATVAIVTHGDVIRALLILLLGMPIDHILRLEIAPASVSEVAVSDGAPVVHSVNQSVWPARP